MLPVLPALSTMQSPTEPGSCYKSRGNAGQRAMELNAKLGQRGTFTPSKRSDAPHIILDSPHALSSRNLRDAEHSRWRCVVCLFCGLSSPLLSCVGVPMTRRGGSRCELTFLEEGQDRKSVV